MKRQKNVDGPKLRWTCMAHSWKEPKLAAKHTKLYNWVIIDPNGAEVHDSAKLVDSNNTSFIVIISAGLRFDSNNEDVFSSKVRRVLLPTWDMQEVQQFCNVVEKQILLVGKENMQADIRKMIMRQLDKPKDTL